MADVKLNEATARNRGDLSDTDSLVVIPHEANDDTGASTHSPEKISWNQLKQEMDARGPGEDNVQANWNEADNTSDAFIQNKPTIPAAETGGTIKSKLEGLSGSARLDASAVKNLPSAGAGEANVQVDWSETDTRSDAYILNKPTIPTAETGGTIKSKLEGLSGNNRLDQSAIKDLPGEDNVQSDWSETDTTDDAFIRNKPTIPAAETADGIKSKLETLTGTNRLDASAVKNLPSGGGSGEANVQVDWNERDTLSDAYILNKPTIPTTLSQLSGTVTDGQIPAEITRDAELAGSITQLKGQGLPANRDTMKELSDAIDAIVPGDDNVQSDWNEGNTGSDAFIRNKPTIPAAEDGASIKSKLEGLSGTNRLDASAVKNLPSGGGSSTPFDLYADTGTQTTALADGDRFVIADVSETGQPNQYLTAVNARKYLKGWRGEWANLTQNTDRLYVGDLVLHNSGYYLVKTEHLRGGSGPDGDADKFARLDNQTLAAAQNTALTEWFNQAVTINTASRLTALPSPNPTIPENGLMIISWFDRGASITESSPIVIPCERLRGLTARSANDDVSSNSAANVIRAAIFPGDSARRAYASFGRTSTHKLLIAVDDASDDPAPLKVWHMPAAGSDYYHFIDATAGNVSLTAAEVADLKGKFVNIDPGGSNRTITFNCAGLTGHVCFTVTNCDHNATLSISGGGSLSSYYLQSSGSGFVVASSTEFWVERFVRSMEANTRGSLSIGTRPGNDQAYILGLANSGVDPVHLNADTDAEKRAMLDRIDAIKAHDLSSGNATLTLNAVNNINGKIVVVDSGGISNRTFTFTNQGMTGRGFCFVVNKGTSAVSLRGRNSGVTSSNSLTAGFIAKVIFATDTFTVEQIATTASLFDLYTDVTTQTTALARGDRFVVADVSDTGQPNKYILATNARRYMKGYIGSWGSLASNLLIEVGDITEHSSAWYICIRQHTKSSSNPSADTTNWIRIDRNASSGGGGSAFDLWALTRSASELHDIDRIVFGDSRTTGNPNTWINAANARKFFKAYRGEWGSLTQNTDRIYIGDVLLHNGGYYLCKAEHLRGGSGPDGDTTNFVAIETYWGDFNASYDYHVGRIVKHDSKFWINDATISSSDPAPGAAGNTKWHQIDGGGSGGATAEPVVETVNANTTFYLNQKWASWKNKRVIFKTNGSDPTITIEPDSGSGLWEPGGELEEQTVDIATSEFYVGSDNVTLEPAAAARTQITETALLPSSGDRYFARARLFTTNSGRLDLLFEADQSVGTGSATNQDLSDTFETSGLITIEINDVRLEVAMSGADTTEPYRLNNLGQNFIDQVNRWRLLGNQSATAKITFSIFDDSDVGDSVGDSIEFEPLWQEAQVQLRHMIFARHNSDGSISTYSGSSAAQNATEGEGVNFRLTFANSFYTGSNTHKWIVSPLTQRVDDVVADFARADNILHKVPASLLPHGHGGQVVGTHVATSGEFRMVDASAPINARITASAVGTDTVTAFVWDIQTNELAQVYSGRDQKLELPYKRRVQNQNGYFLQAVRAADDAVTSEIFIPFDMSSGSDLRFIDSDGNLADLELFATTTNNASAGSAFRLTRWTIEPNEQFWIEWNPGTGPNWTAKFADDEFFYIKVYEWIDSASPIAQSGGGGSAQGQGAFDLRREEEVAVNLSSSIALLGGSTGFRVDENATHLEMEIEAPSNLSPNGVVWNYQLPGSNIWHDLYDDDGDRILLHRSSTIRYRFNESFFHVSGGRNYVKTRLSSANVMSGALVVTLKHEEDVNSASIKPLTLLSSPVVVAATTLDANLANADFTEVELDSPVEWDNVQSLFISLGTNNSSPYELSEFPLRITKDEIDYVGDWRSTDDLTSGVNMRAWFSVGWAHATDRSSATEWRHRVDAAFCYYWANDADGAIPSRLVALKKEGAYLTAIYVAGFRQQVRVEYVSCMRKI